MQVRSLDGGREGGRSGKLKRRIRTGASKIFGWRKGGREVWEVDEMEYMARASMIIIYDYVLMYRARQYSIVT